ncbi:TonB-dependent siderophore receptor [Caulobacter sp. NIBR2454]|uniref:TonB-dependent siderophore receptor n=1 Tax=Caulobacter sp. NIBR2454 TaxID=3015996 RepID=UPI0022B6F59C|nr:TonB-dependent siderophore receptor [Caulobacter sp. NIBR2454]
MQSFKYRALAGAGLSVLLCANAAPAWAEAADTAVSSVTVEGAKGGYVAKTVTVGGKEPVSVLEVPNTISVITQQRIQDQNLVTMVDALAQVPGVYVSTWDGLIGQIRSRGYLLDVSYDGIPAWNSGQAQEFDLVVYEQIEVLRGPAGIFKGSGQPSGTANFVRKRAPGEFFATVAASAGTWNNYRVEADIGGPLALDGRLRGRFAGSYLERDFFTDRSHEEKVVAYGALDLDITDHTLASAMITYQDDRGEALSMGLANYALAGHPSHNQFLDVPRSTNQYPDWNLNVYETLEYAADLRHELDNDWVLRAKATYREQRKIFNDGYPTPGIGLNPVTGRFSSYNRRDNDGTTDRTGVDLYASGPLKFLGRDHLLTLGYSYELYEQKNTGVSNIAYTGTPAAAGISLAEAAAVPRPNFVHNNGGHTRTEQTGFYGQGRFEILDGLSLVLGARLSDFDSKFRTTAPNPNPTNFASQGKEEDVVTPYGGLVYYLRPNITLYGSYSDIFVPQTALKWDAGGGTPLDPRVGKQIEGGVKGTFFNEGLNASLAIFRTRDVNRSFADVAHPGFFLQLGEVEVRGADLEITGRPMTGVDLSFGYSFLETEHLANSNASLVGAAFDTWEPKHTLKAFAKYTPSAAGWSRGWIAAGMHAQSTFIGAGVAGVREQDPYAIFSLHAGYALTPKIALSASLNNVFDKVYYARIGGPNTYNTYGDPRNITVALRARF